MRNYILQKYIDFTPETVVVGHHGLIHLPHFLWTMLILLILWLFYSIVQAFFPSLVMITRFIAGGAVMTYGRFLISFLNHYLDAIIITPQGLRFFYWEKLFQYHQIDCHRDHIESINHSQHSFSDKLCNKGSISIAYGEGKLVSFKTISNPNKLAKLLWEHKSAFEYRQQQQLIASLPPQQDVNNEKFSILVETLGEVIKDYMDRDKQKQDTNGTPSPRIM